MTNNPTFSVQLLEKIGAPLLASIEKTLAGGDEEQTATIMAQLLALSVQMSTSLYNALDIKEAEDQMDSTRLALAALSAPLIAQSFERQGQAPNEENIKRMCESLEAVLTFGENFTPAPEQKSRLHTIGHDEILFDDSQPMLMTIQAMVPVINAVEEFPFGQGRRKLVQDVAAKLQSLTDEMAKKNNTQNGASDRVQELVIFKTLASLYASCHRAETARVSSDNNTDRDNVSLAPVWENFETKISMVEALMGFESDAVATPQDTKAPAVEAAAAESEASPQQAEPEKPAASNGGGGPMGFFKKTDDNNPTPDLAPAAESAPATTPSEAATATTTTTTEAPKSDANASGSPMGFFKPGAKKEES